MGHNFEGMNESEILLYNRCKRLESDNFKVIPNAMFERQGEGTNQIDLIAVTKKGIFVIEMKDYKGWIFGDENHKIWTQSLNGGRGRSSKYKLRNPVKQNENHIKTVKGILEKKGYNDLPIYNVVVFSDRAVLKSIDSSVDVVNLSNIENVFRKYRDIMISKEEISDIYNYFNKENIKDAKVRSEHLEFIHNIKGENKKEDNNSVVSINKDKSHARVNKAQSGSGKNGFSDFIEEHKIIILGLFAFIGILFIDKGFMLVGSILMMIMGLKLKDKKAIKGAIILGVFYLITGPVFGHTDDIILKKEPINTAVIVNEPAEKPAVNLDINKANDKIVVKSNGNSTIANETTDMAVTIEEKIESPSAEQPIVKNDFERVEVILLGTDGSVVKKLIGEPDKIYDDGSNTIWKYGLGYVSFDQNMKVNGWDDHSGRLKKGMYVREEGSTPLDLGITREEVLKAVGSPDKINTASNNVWGYGLGYISFNENWEVNGWDDHSGRLKKGMYVREEGSTPLDLGITREEVLKAVGSPDKINTASNNVWGYGLGYISFNVNWEVNGWDDHSGRLKKGMYVREEGSTLLNLGITREEVLKAVGSPDKINAASNNVWGYGLGYISFNKNWEVNGWDDHSGRLKNGMRIQDNGASLINVGSTVEEVLQAVGSPNKIHPSEIHTWYYGLSKIIVDDNWLVSGWYNHSNTLTEKVVSE